MGDSNANLPLGFWFYPTNEELVVHFLHRRAALLRRALAEGNQWYYYSKRTQNRVTANDYWNPMGIKEAAVSNSSNRRVDIKKFYVFYVREAPDGNRTNRIMQEYRFPESTTSSSRL
ncbi:hypothetical protein HN51_026234 [Arachis hypogaea]